MSRLDRYGLAVQLAQDILQGNPRHDELRIQQLLDDVIDEVRAGRRNQAEWPQIKADLEARGVFSARVDEPHLTLVKGGSA